MTLDSSCGLFNWRPKWLQRFKTPRWFTFILFLVFFLKGTPNTYYLTLIDVILKRFGLNSEQFQWVISSSELGIIPIIIFFPLIKFIKKKPVCLMLAVWVMAMGLLICTIPKIMGTKTSSNIEDTFMEEYHLLLAGYFFFGLGFSILNAVGIPYIDSNVPEEQSPAYVGCVLAGGLSAKFFGGLFGEFIKNVHGDELEEDYADWWAGFVLVAFGMLYVSPFLAMFPNTLISEESQDSEEEVTMESSKNHLVEYLKSLGRLISNKVFMLSLLSHVFSYGAVLGFRNNFSVFQLYMFNKTSKEAKIGVVLAVTTILSSVVMAAVGATIKHFKINIQPLISWNILVCLVSITCTAILYSTGCDVPIIYRETDTFNNISSSCNTDCNSSWSLEFFCAEDKKHQFLSLCHAGCTGPPVIEDKDTFYHDCKCAAEALANTFDTVGDTFGGTVIKGPCPGNCDDLYTFFIALVIILPSLWVSGPLGVSRFLITMRCIHEEDKEVGVLMLLAAGSLLSGFLSPPIFGSILDNSCKFRPEGSACQLYDSEEMRKNFFLGIMLALNLVIVLEVLIFIFGKRLKLYSRMKK